MKHLDAFAGIGGFSVAAEKVGIETVAFVERDPFCRAVLGKHFPLVPIADDIKNVTVDTVASLLNDRAWLSLEETKMGAPRKDFSEAVKLYERGLSIGDVAAFYGMSRQAMWKILQRRNVVFREQQREAEANHFYRGTKSDWAAHDLVERAVEKGLLTPQPCEKCGEFPLDKNGKRLIQAHHDDYNKPLEIRWLCQRHHYEWHKTNKAIPREETAKPAVARSVDLITGGFP